MRVEPQAQVLKGKSFEGLWRAVARSVRDNVAAEGIVQTLRVGGMVFLARTLTPDDFGIFRVLLVVGTLVGLANQTGIPDAMVRRRIVRSDHESTAWWLSTTIAAASSIMLYITAPLIAEAMAMPGLLNGLRLLCIPLLLEGTAVTAGACLRRQLNFTALASADVVAELVFLATALIWLWRGHTYLCLPAALAARFSAHAAAIWIAEPRFPRTLPSRRAMRDFARFTGAVWSGQFIYVLSSNVDYLLIGRLLGSAALGFYSIAWDLLRFVPDRLHRVAGRVTFPAFCQLQDDDKKLASAYVNFLGYISRMVLPIAACAALAAPEVVTTIYGNKWAAAALPMRLLATGLAISGLRLGMGEVFYAKNRPGIDFYIHGARLIAIVIAIECLSGLGLVGVSAGMSLVECGISALGMVLACRLVGVGLVEMKEALLPAVRATAVCFCAVLLSRFAAMLLRLPPAGMLATDATLSTLAYVWLERSTLIDTIEIAFHCQVGRDARIDKHVEVGG